MIILFLSNNLGYGGKERQIAEILTFLAKTTPHQYILLLRGNSIDFYLPVLSNLKIIKPPKRLTFLQFILFQKKVINEICPDIIHSWEGVVTLSAIIMRLISGSKCKIIDGSLRYAKKFGYFSKMNFINMINATFANVVVANSNAGLTSAGFQEKGKFHVLTNGFDMSQFSSYEVSKNKDKILLIVMVASFTAAKDFQSMVRAAISIFDAGHAFQVLFVGNGPERGTVEQSIPDKYKNRFIFTGYLPSKKVLELVSKSDIGILLSKKGHSEGMSNTIMEYMILGIPVICTATGGNPELICDDYNGFLIPHEDTAILAEKLKLLLRDENKRMVMGERSKKIACEKFAIEKVAPQYLELYSSLLKE